MFPCCSTPHTNVHRRCPSCPSVGGRSSTLAARSGAQVEQPGGSDSQAAPLYTLYCGGARLQVRCPPSTRAHTQQPLSPQLQTHTLTQIHTSPAHPPKPQTPSPRPPHTPIRSKQSRSRQSGSSCSHTLRRSQCDCGPTRTMQDATLSSTGMSTHMPTPCIAAPTTIHGTHINGSTPPTRAPSAKISSASCCQSLACEKRNALRAILALPFAHSSTAEGRGRRRCGCRAVSSGLRAVLARARTLS
eukprot:1421-Chlamydomonas_euryale.AAC.6